MFTLALFLTLLLSASAEKPWAGYVVYNGDCPGHDIGNFPVDTLEECKALCDAKSECLGFHRNDENRSCWLKTISDCGRDIVKSCPGGACFYAKSADFVQVFGEGTCETLGNYKTITDSDTCEAAARFLNKQDTTVNVHKRHGPAADRPFGCTYHHFQNLEFWTESTGVCTFGAGGGKSGCLCEADHHYIGCFKDNSDRDLDTFKGRASSVSECNSACYGYDFFGLQAVGVHGNKPECRCGNDYSSSAAYSRVDDSECPQRANLDEARAGGAWRNAVYFVTNTKPAFWETCRWQDASPEEKHGGHVTLMGYACNDDEILVGFELDSDAMVDKIKCCGVGGHSSVTKTCSIETSQAHKASCDGNQHKVFNGVYDKRDADVDEFGEVLMGKCCEVKCHEKWCGKNEWGVNTDEGQCIDIGFQNQGTQDLECPIGYLMTSIHDVSAKGRQHGVQKIDKISCCPLHTISAPTQAPSVSPSLSPSRSPTTAPTPAPTTKPSTSPTTAPSSHPTTSPTTAPTSVGECLLALRNAALTDKQFLEGIEDCVPCFDYIQRRNLAGRLLNESHKY